MMVRVLVPILGCVLASVLFTAIPASGNSIRTDPKSFAFDEKLVYGVSYLGIRIGTVEILNKFDDEKPTVTETMIVLRTFSGIPFVSVHTEFYGSIGSDGYFGESLTFDRERGRWAYYRATREPETFDIRIERGYQDIETGAFSSVEIDSVRSERPVLDALAFLTVLRDSAHTGLQNELDILVDRSIEKIVFDRTEAIDAVGVSAFGNEVIAYHVSGTINFTAIHGLSRRYQAWVSADDRRIPVQARVHIGIGSVKLELKEYTMREQGKEMTTRDE
jgi:hypothetical protein